MGGDGVPRRALAPRLVVLSCGEKIVRASRIAEAAGKGDVKIEGRIVPGE
jgi:hypothetical protein